MFIPDIANNLPQVFCGMIWSQWFEPWYDKTNTMTCALWSESSLSAWRSLGPQLHTERTAKTLIRLGGCPGWFEASLGAHSFCWFCHVAAHLFLPKTPNGNGTQTPWAQAESQETGPFRVVDHQAIPNKEYKTSGTNWPWQCYYTTTETSDIWARLYLSC